MFKNRHKWHFLELKVLALYNIPVMFVGICNYSAPALVNIRVLATFKAI